MSANQLDPNLPSDQIRAVPDYIPMGSTQSFSDEQSWGGANIQDHIKILLKHKLLVASMTLGCMLVGMLYIFTATPIYEAKNRVRISQYQPTLAGSSIENVAHRASERHNYLETQIQEIKSLSLGDKVLNNPGVKAILNRKVPDGFIESIKKTIFSDEQKDEAKLRSTSSPYTNDVAKIESLLARIEVVPVRKTTLVEIVVKNRDPEAAALIANTHAQAYIDWVREVRVKQQSRGLKFLEEQASELRTKVADLEREMADYAEEHSIVALNKDENITLQKMAQLNRLLTEATARKIEAAHVYGESLKSVESGDGTMGSVPVGDRAAQDMRSRLGTLEAEYGQLSAKFTDEYPRMKQLKAQIMGLKQSIKERKSQLVVGLKAKAEAAKEEETNLKEELEQQKSKAFELSKKQVEYNILNRELASTRELLQNVTRQKKETSLAVESNASNVDIVDYAVAPDFPSAPRKKLILVACTALGLLLGACLALLLGVLDNTLHTPEETTNLLSLPSLGVVPRFESEPMLALPNPGTSPANQDSTDAETIAISSGDGDNSTLPIASVDADPASGSLVYFKSPKSLASEAYRTIRTGVILSQAGEPPKTILVSSAQPSEGKTTLSANLGACLGSSGGSVVIIDADLRRPSLWKYFGVDRRQAGVVDILTGQCSIEEASVKSPEKNITIITSGKIPPNPAELLGSTQMQELLKTLAEQYDFVLIDSPPILPVTDSVMLSRFVDGVIVVIKGSTTPKKVIHDAVERLRKVGANVIGTILNNVDLNRSDYRYYNRYYYAQYYAEDEQEDEQQNVVGI